MVPGKKHSSAKAVKCFEGRYCGDDSCSRLGSVRGDGEQHGVCVCACHTELSTPCIST